MHFVVSVRRTFKVIAVVILVVYVAAGIAALGDSSLKSFIRHHDIWFLAIPGALGVGLGITALFNPPGSRS